MAQRLRIGLLMDSLDVPAWTHAMLEKVLNLQCAGVVLIVFNADAAHETRPRSRLKRIYENRSTLFYSLYWIIENRLFKCSPDAFERKDASALLAGIPRMTVRPRRTEHSDYFSDADLKAVRRARLDVLIRLGFRIVRGDILKAAKYGIWSYHHGDNDVNRGGPPGFWEVIENNGVTGCVLQVLNEEMDNGIVLVKSYGPALPLSVKRNRHYLFWKSVSFVPRQLAEIARNGGSRFIRKVRNQSKRLAFYSHRLYKKPGNVESLRCILLTLKRYIAYRAFRLVFKEQWLLLSRQADGLSTAPGKFQKIVPPKDRFWADPQVLCRNGRRYVFAEEFVYKRDKGHLCVFNADDRGRLSGPEIILEKPYHLSYPFVFEHEGEAYLVPESADHRTIELYRAADFPRRWEFVRHLMKDVSAFDATLLHHQNRWWLFAVMKENEGCSPWDELFLFYASSLFSKHWTPHPKNPVVMDIRRARPAGRIFLSNGRLIRPSQDCSKHYGYRVVFNEITRLDRHEYAERPVGVISPDWDRRIRNVHTFSYQNGLTVLDGMKRRLKWL